MSIHAGARGGASGEEEWAPSAQGHEGPAKGRNKRVGGEPAVVVLDREGIVRWAAPKGSPTDVIAAAARAVAAR